MTTTFGGTAATRRVFFRDASAPPATVVTPAAFVAVRWRGGRLLLVRRRDSGLWDLPGGRSTSGRSQSGTAEEAGVHVVVTGAFGLFTDPRPGIRSSGGEVRQQLAVLFRARATGGAPPWRHAGDERRCLGEGRRRLPASIDRPIRGWIDEALFADEVPRLE